jgi:membrane protease YdiL (CAAX protease family)
MNFTKILIFLSITFGIAWLAAGIMHLFSITYGSIASTLIVACIIMPSPAVATIIVQKWIYKSSLKEYGFTVRKESLRYFLLAAFFYLAFILLTVLIIYLLGNILGINGFGRISFETSDIIENIRRITPAKFAGAKVNLPSTTFLIILGVLGGIISGFSINMLFSLGEELGWRGLLLNEFGKLGFWKTNLLIGSVWGLWHAPIILMGHNPNYPLAGCFMMILLCIALSCLHVIIKMKTKSIFGPAAFHGMINGGAPVTILIIVNNNELVGSIVGLAGIVSATIVVCVYFLIDTEFLRERKALSDPLVS